MGLSWLCLSQLGTETQAASPPCRLSIRSTQPPISQVGLLRLRAGKAWTLTPAPPQCPQGQPPPDPIGRLGCPLPFCPAPQNGPTLPSLFHVRPPPLPGCPPRQRRPGLHHYLPAQRGALSHADPALCRRGKHLTFTTPAALIDWECLPAASRNHLALSAWTGRRLDKRWTSRLPPRGGGCTPGVSPLRRPCSWPPLQALRPGPASQSGRAHCADSQGQGTKAH